MHIATRPLRVAVAIGAVALLAAAGCSSDSSGSSSDTTEASPTTAVDNAEVVKFDKSIQQQLADVGCYSGPIDGAFGPQTDAAVIAFQTAEGLEPDGEVGPETEAALNEAVAKGETVCTGSSSTTSSSSTTVPDVAPCTATAVAAALPSGAEINDYACSDGYAGVAYTASGSATTALLESESGAWKDLGNSMCGGASAGYPPAVLSIVCPS